LKPKESLYLDTSVPSAYYDERVPERQRETQNFWDKLSEYDVIISTLTIDEIRATPDEEKRNKLIALITGFKVVEVTPESEALAERYVEYGIVPQKYIRDALHVAIATLKGIDIFVSWNFRHIVKRRTRLLVNLVNTLSGYRTIDIVSPNEL
jgi:predicted nucleic acid-binding protein